MSTTYINAWNHEEQHVAHYAKEVPAWLPAPLALPLEMPAGKVQMQQPMQMPLPMPGIYSQESYSTTYMEDTKTMAAAPVRMLLSPLPPEESPSRTSSPFSSSLHSPLPLGWADSESESAAESLHSGSGSGNYSSSGVTTPYESQVHSPNLHPSAPPPPQLQQQNTLPTISEQNGGMLKPQPQPHQPAHQPPHPNPHQPTPSFASPSHHPLRLSTCSPIGFLPLHSMDSNLDSAPAATTTATPSYASNPSLNSIPGRAKPRNRYRSAAAASAAACASLASHPNTPQTHEREVSFSSSASGHSSADEETDRRVAPAPAPAPPAAPAPAHNAQAKRKRVASRKASAAAADDHEEEGSEYGASPVNGAGLDKRARNKLSASQYRKRRKMYLDSLEGRVGELDGTIQQQAAKMQEMSAENMKLREQLSLFKRMLAKINPALVGDAEAALASGSAAAARQPTNVHPGGRVPRGGVGAFLLALVSCILLCQSGSLFSLDSQPTTQFTSMSTPTRMEVGHRSRNLLFVDDSFMMNQPSSDAFMETTHASFSHHSAILDSVSIPIEELKTLTLQPNAHSPMADSDSDVVDGEVFIGVDAPSSTNGTMHAYPSLFTACDEHAHYDQICTHSITPQDLAT